MYRILSIALVVNALMILPLVAQPNQLRASISGNGGSPEGNCLIEVAVSGTADLEIRGDNGILRTASGARSEWGRFECSARMPDYPVDLRVRSVAGRGNVQLVQSRNAGAVVVRIDGPPGMERHTLELAWTVERPYDNNNPGNSASGIGSNSNRRRDVANEAERLRPAFSTDEAIRVCEQGVREQARPRLGPGDLEFRGVRIDNTQLEDSILGEFAFFSANRSEVIYRFACSVDFARARVGSVQIDQAAGDAYATPGRRVPASVAPALLNCQDAIQARLQRSGYVDMSFVSIDLDQRPGRKDWVVGSAQAQRGNRPVRLDFSCRMNLGTGNVRTVNITRR